MRSTPAPLDAPPQALISRVKILAGLNIAGAVKAIMAGIVMPLFDGGTLMHKERAARAALEQAAAQYRSTVISALQNVADALRALQADADALKAAVIAEQAAARSLQITRSQLQLGAINYTQLLQSQQIYEQALLTLVQAKAARFADTGALFQALGGGWWNRTDPEPPPTGGPFADIVDATAQP